MGPFLPEKSWEFQSDRRTINVVFYYSFSSFGLYAVVVVCLFVCLFVCFFAKILPRLDVYILWQ